MNRRKLLQHSGLVLAGLGAGAHGSAQTQTSGTPFDSTRVPGTLTSARGERSPFVTLERQTPNRELSSVSYTPLQALRGVITPADLHFERHHAGIPAIDPASYQLLIHGMVDRPLTFTLADLQRFPTESKLCFIECSGNGMRATFEGDMFSEAVTPQTLDGLFSVSEWSGVRLSTLLEEAGVRRGARWLLAEGQDAAVMTRSVPLTKAFDDALIAYAQNGEPLRPAQGYPVRLLLPGWEGNMSVKWLRRIEVGERPFMTREETSKYSDALKDGRIEQFTFTMGPKSLITSPSYPDVLTARGFHEIRGIAWSGHGKVRKVEVSVDGGRRWHAAKLLGPALDKCAVAFTAAWTWDGKPALLLSRTTDQTGATQVLPAEAAKTRGPGTRYHHNAIRAWHVAADGRVTFGLGHLA